MYNATRNRKKTEIEIRLKKFKKFWQFSIKPTFINSF